MPKAIITTEAFLTKKRSDNKYHVCRCVNSSLDIDNKFADCGDWCPFFSGPVRILFWKRLSLCYKSLWFKNKNLYDERKSGRITVQK